MSQLRPPELLQNHGSWEPSEVTDLTMVMKTTMVNFPSASFLVHEHQRGATGDAGSSQRGHALRLLELHSDLDASRLQLLLHKPIWEYAEGLKATQRG